MRLGAMQPYFFPYAGYFSLISATDKWISFDCVQYIRHGWMNRNRILHSDPTKEWMYIITPLKKHPREILIKDVQLSEDPKWRKRILGQLMHYKKKAPYYQETMEIILKCLRAPIDDMASLNLLTLEEVCKVLSIKFDYEPCSEMDLDIDNLEDPGDWALALAQHTGASEYINPINGRDLFNKDVWKEAGIDISFLRWKEVSYDQKRKPFIGNLSIIDLLMFNEPDTVREMINSYEIIE